MSGDAVGVVDVVVGVSVVVLAVAAVVVPRRLASVVCFLVFGVLLSLVWGLAGAPDVALAEAAIGAGVTGVLFVDTVTRSRPGAGRAGRRASLSRRHQLVGAALALVAVALTAGLTSALWRAAVPRGDVPGLSGAVREALPATGVDHGVTAVLLNLRSFDTLLEMAVLLVAVVAVLSVSHPDPHPTDPGAVAPLQRSAAGLLVPVLVMLATWLLLAGSSRPGGAFQAGAALAGVVLVLHLTGRTVLPPGRAWPGAVAVAGLAAFLLVAAVGPWLGGAWLELDPAWSGPLIIALESVLAVSIGASLGLIALALRGEAAR